MPISRLSSAMIWLHRVKFGDVWSSNSVVYNDCRSTPLVHLATFAWRRHC